MADETKQCERKTWTPPELEILDVDETHGLLGVNPDAKPAGQS